MNDTEKRVLLLDDDEPIAKTLQSMLTRLGYTVRWTGDHLEFFKQVSEWSPQFIFIDLVMPKMDGVEVIEKLAEYDTQAKIVITSGAHPRVLDAAKRSAIEHGLGIVGVLRKPFKSDTLRRLLDVPGASDSGFANSSSTGIVSKLEVDDLEQALKRNEIYIVVQPKVYCENQNLAGFEVLARWDHKEHGAISPEVFIELAEKNGLIDSLTEQVVSKALHWLAEVPERIVLEPELSGMSTQLSNLILSINISALSLTNKDLFLEIGNLCETLNIRTNRIILELTETSAMENPLASLDILTRLRVQGFMVSLDDFGTGYSSMKQLVRLPFSEIKVDKSFVISSLSNVESMTIMRSIIELGRSLGLSTTAEGVESAEIMKILKDLGCELGQGFYISKPLTLEAIDAWIVAHLIKCEKERLAELAHTELLDSDPEERFDRHTRYAQQYFDVAYAAVSLVARNRQWFKSNAGLPGQGSDRDESFCAHTISGRDVFEVPDATQHPLFAQYEAVLGEPNVRYYAGMPLKGLQGQHIGAFCIIDTKPRKLDSNQLDKLRALAKLVESELRITISATTDKLTGALNGDGLDARAHEMLLYAYKLSLPVAQLTLRIENLRDINKTFGYELGNQALLKVCEVFRTITRGSDLVGRYSGSQFKAYLLNIPEERVETVVARLKTHLEEVNSRSDSYQIEYRCNAFVAQNDDDFVSEFV